MLESDVPGQAGAVNEDLAAEAALLGDVVMFGLLSNQIESVFGQSEMAQECFWRQDKKSNIFIIFVL